MADTLTASPSELIRPDQLPDIVTHPEVAKLPFTDREKVFERGVGEAADWMTQNGGWTPETYRGFGEAVGKLRGDLKDSETLGEKAKWAGKTAADMALGVAHAANAVAQDALPKSKDGQWRVPFSEAGPMVMRGFNKVGPALAVLGDEMAHGKQGVALEDELKKFKGELDAGSFPFDSEGLTGWLKQRSDALSAKQKDYYDEVDPKLREVKGVTGAVDKIQGMRELADYAGANGLNAPRNAELVAEYLRTRSPKAWGALRENLIQLPSHAAADEAQRKIAADSDTAKRINADASERWGRKEGELGQESLMAAGDPVNTLSMVAPYLAATSKEGTMVSRFIKGTAHAQALGALGLAVQRPGATPEDYWENAKHMFAGALGMQVAGEGVRAMRGKPKESSVATETATTELPPQAEPVEPQTDAIAGELFNNTGREGASNAEFSALDGHAKTAIGVEESTPAVAAAPEPPASAEPPAPAPSIPETPPQITFRTFDENGKLKATKEAPHEEAMKELRGRESMLQKILDCLTKKAA